jgi:hypothetical protein
MPNYHGILVIGSTGLLPRCLDLDYGAIGLLKMVAAEEAAWFDLTEGFPPAERRVIGS